jgi:hypothetical protein
MASVIAYFLSVCSAAFMFSSLFSAFSKADRNDAGAVANLFGFFLFGIMAWGFAYLGGAF